MEIYNGALLHLGSEPLASLVEEGTKRRKLDAAWDSVVKWCLNEAYFNFSIRTVEVSEDEDVETLFGYQFAFSKPDDWVRTAAVSADEYCQLPLIRYRDENGYWYADIDPIYVQYVSNDEEYGLNIGAWPETFVVFAEYALAQKVCKAVTGSSDGTDTLYKKMIRAKRDAANKDAMDDPATKFLPEGRLVSSRQGSRLGSREGRFRAG
ncbi:hypothetical protein LRP31_25455 [Mesorhizobium mediterraneum]|uniref:Uncharacterized protein n=1 Tax=Mesorhizobium mediterraneum TaxID=43617 RepID=A0AB36R7T2_9HYPH|nr:hypothetical protein [Mesorhizobium mediterraneum]PAQ00906.1 hypothetical protein CIT25_17725 [Mesorhizobium mediterraneum]WIW52369.1 hypothetical protein LRP31_25455 [Mesorhizobium mediterraneum]